MRFNFYDIPAEIFPIRIVVMKELPGKEYLWLHSLTNHLDRNVPLEELVQEYSLHREEDEYENYMNQFIRANFESEEEGKMMCEAMYELFADELLAREKHGLEQGRRQGRIQGRRQGEQRFADLINKLISDNRSSEIERAASDAGYRKKLLAQYQL